MRIPELLQNEERQKLAREAAPLIAALLHLPSVCAEGSTLSRPLHGSDHLRPASGVRHLCAGCVPVSP